MPALFQSPLATFARFVPKEPGSTPIGGDFAYGDHPRQKPTDRRLRADAKTLGAD